MAVAFEGFCIREFASKMRSVDLVKSWPFGGDSDMQQIESALPPITVAKFRWWQHELEATRSTHASSSDAADHLEEKSDEPLFGCTVCGGFKTSGNENAATQAEIGNFEKKQSTRARSKAPKKRSIVEIFAVAPPIDTVTRQEGSSTGRNSDSTRAKKKKKKNTALKTRHLPILDRKLKKVRRNASFAKKEICHKFKHKTSSDLRRNFDRLHDKMCTSGKLQDADGTHRRNPSCKPSSSQKKHKNIAPSKFITKKHKEVETPVRGVLKKQRKYVSGKDNAYSVPDENSQAADQLEKHVRFLVKNDKIDGEANTHVVTQQSNLREIFTGVDRLSSNEVAVSENENSISVEKLQVAKEKEITLADTCGQGNLKNYLQVSTFQEDLNNFPGLSTSPNHHIPKFCGDVDRSTKGKSIVSSDDASYPWHSRLLPTVNGASSNTDMAGSSDRPVSFRSEFTSSQQVGPCRAAYAASSVPKTTNASLQSTSYSNLLLNENVKDQRLPFPSHSMMSDSSFIPPLSASHPHQMNPIGGSFSYKEWNHIGVTSSERSLNENLYGLPLNSRGELIHLSSSGNFMLDQQSGPSRRTDDRSRPKDLNFFPIHVYADETPNSIPSRNYMAEPCATVMENSGGLVNLNSSSHLSVADLMCSNGQGRKVVAATTTPPVTMRLMGKDVSIGRNSRIRSEEEKDPVLKTSAPEKSRGGLVNISFGGQNNSDYFSFPPPDPRRVRDPYINWQPDATVQIGSVPITRHCHQGGTIFQVENVRDPYLLNGGGLRFGSQIGTPFVPHESSWIDIKWGPELMYRQNNVHAPRVPNSFGFPPDCRECFQEPYWSRNNSFTEVVSPPPWLFHATSDQRNTTAYTNHRSQHLYGASPGNRRRSSSSSSTQPTFHFPEPYYYSPMASQSQMRSPLGVENVYRVDSVGFGCRDHTRASKRPAVFDLRRPYKAPTLELQVVHPSIDLSLDIGRNVEHCELDLHNNGKVGSNIGLERNQRVSDRRLKPSAGPTKLRAGTKHILKPCQNTDKGNSGPARTTWWK